MVRVYLGLGSNMRDRWGHLRAGVEAVGRLAGTRVVRESPVYESEPWGPVDQPNYLNMVVEVATELEPEELLGLCKEIEKVEGRVPGVRWGQRPLDIDILLYGDRRIETGTLTVPHPRMWERAFVLRPLADIAPDLRGPGGKAIIGMLEDERIRLQGVWPYREEV
ncbi:MAG: 2-amino-4-hydroxy-6-hydroxymethyldihydropteridine diphosphokinase [Chloroflexia bacterium]